MSRPLHLHTLLLVLCASPLNFAQLAWMEDDLVVVQEQQELVEWPGSRGADTFCWDREGRNILVTRGGKFQRLARDGRRTTLAQRFSDLRFPDVCAVDDRIVFAAMLVGAELNEWHLRVIDSDGRGNLELGAGYDPVFLPDGSGVVFECFEAPGPDLWLYRFDTRARTRLFAQHQPRYTPAISPDGKRVAFTSSGRLILADLADLAGGSQRDLSPQGSTYDRFASFSPDGNSIAFFRERANKTSLVLRQLSGEERIIDADARATLPLFQPLRAAPMVRTLTMEQAAALVEAAGRKALELPDLEELNHETARVLAATRGSLARSIHELRAKAPKTLAGKARRRARPEATCRSLRIERVGATQSGQRFRRLEPTTHDYFGLVLNKLAQLDLAGAQALAHWEGNGECFFLGLDGLREPAPEVVAALAQSMGWGLSFGQITELSEPYLKALAPYRGARVRLHGLLEFDDATAKRVAAKWLEVDFETRVSPSARAALKASQVSLLDGSN